MSIVFSKQEFEILSGLPHMQQLLYLKALRPYVDYKSSIIGIRRGISYQSLAEELYVEPHSGIQSGSPSRDQLRRALQGLERAGVIKLLSQNRKLIIQCCLLKADKSAQNKPAINPPQDPATVKQQKVIYLTDNYPHFSAKAALAKSAEPTTPLNNNLFIFLQRAFETFWEAYPVKRSRQQAWEAFQAVAPDESLLSKLLAALAQQKQVYAEAKQCKHWLPNWKHPANWLRQHCWEDEITLEKSQEPHHENSHPTSRKKSASALLWESCRGSFDTEDSGTESTSSHAQTY